MPKSKLRKKVQESHAQGIGAWNMIIGFTFIGVGFSLATKWR